MKKVLVVALMMLAAASAGCSSPQDAERALTNAGFTQIRTHGYDWFACSRDDFYHTKFTAMNPQGQRVSGVVCSGLIFKSATIRF